MCDVGPAETCCYLLLQLPTFTGVLCNAGCTCGPLYSRQDTHSEVIDAGMLGRPQSSAFVPCVLYIILQLLAQALNVFSLLTIHYASVGQLHCSTTLSLSLKACASADSTLSTGLHQGSSHVSFCFVSLSILDAS